MVHLGPRFRRKHTTDGTVDQSALIRPGYAHYRQMRLSTKEDQLHKMAGGQMQYLVAVDADPRREAD